jgi:hypothetical protein
MYGSYSSLMLWTVAGVQLLGFFSALLSRLGEGSCGEGGCQCFFLLCLALVGMATILSLVMGSDGWLSCGVTLSAMVVIALYDRGTTKEVVV